MKRRSMCGNPACERFSQPTGLMGGCECGQPLVAYREPTPAAAAGEPTNQQLEGLMQALGMPVMPGMLEWAPQHRKGALNFHRLVQAAVGGDRAAAQRLAQLRAAFGRH